MLSQKPYLIRAIHQWCQDNNLTPYLASIADHTTQVPQQYVNDGQIVLDINGEAIQDLIIGNDWITFSATFSGILYHISLPIQNILAIFAKENGQGMQFEVVQPNPADDEPVAKHGLKLVK